MRARSAIALAFLAVALGAYALGRVHQERLTADSAKTSYAEKAEDLIVADIFWELGLGEVRYLDIGAGDPVDASNTYLFYTRGAQGVLVEPNPVFGPQYAALRPRDKVLAVGVGVTDQREADYHVVEGHWALNTFDKDVADEHARAGMKVSVVKMPLVNINEIIARNFTTPPNFLSIDIEGLDLAVLESLDFDRYRPAVICVETLVVDTQRTDPRIETFLRSKNYSPRGGSFVNTIFVANELVKR
ncbi:MAG: FkbM family methyltransferase [Gemmatimonadetes bacterium]|nr:FkbM family methyltransferase [Gemmatimonadota bacterium]